jgi:hypothetical protein
MEDFVSSLNKLGSEGWEASSGAYAAGESKRFPSDREWRLLPRSAFQLGRSFEAFDPSVIPIGRS